MLLTVTYKNQQVSMHNLTKVLIIKFSVIQTVTYTAFTLVKPTDHYYVTIT